MRRHFIPIWFFIGILLDIYGALILGAGIYDLVHPPEQSVQMAYLHAGIWWGFLLIVMGVFYTLRFRPKKEKK